MTALAVLELLNGRLAQLALDPPLPVAWQEVPFDPQGAAYLEQTFIPGAASALTLSDVDEHVGVYQVTVCVPADQGVTAAMAVAEVVAAWFNRGLVLYGGGLVLKMTRPAYLAPPMRDDPWLRVPVTVPYRVFAAVSES